MTSHPAASPDSPFPEGPVKRRHVLGATAGMVAGALSVPANAEDAPILKMLDDFAAAWNRHDVDALMACMAPECVFEASAGKEVAGARHVGPEAVRRAYAAVFETYADARWNHPRHFVAGNRAVSEWTFTGTTKDGAKVEVNGCDVFTLEGAKIAVKSSYRKQRSA